MKKLKYYALYKGDKLITIGTAKDIATHQGIKVASLRRYGTPEYASRSKKNNNRKLLIEIGEE